MKTILAISLAAALVVGCDSSILRGIGSGLVVAGNVIRDTGNSIKDNT